MDFLIFNNENVSNYDQKIDRNYKAQNSFMYLL